MESLRNSGADDPVELIEHVLRLNAKVLGLALGFISGMALFLGTNWLVLKGGDSVGPHLQLLSQYFVGYSVSFRGSLVGFVYGAAVGGSGGFLLGAIYNLMVRWRHKGK